MKEYVKPELYYEDFELSQHIALCDLKLNNGAPESCEIVDDRVDDGVSVVGGFVATNICKFPYEIYCYTNGSGSMPKTFQS